MQTGNDAMTGSSIAVSFYCTVVVNDLRTVIYHFKIELGLYTINSGIICSVRFVSGRK